MIRNYIKMKKAEWKIKITVYDTINTLIDSNKEVLNLLRKLYTALKDVPAEELRTEFIGELAKIIHDENQKTAH